MIGGRLRQPWSWLHCVLNPWLFWRDKKQWIGHNSWGAHKAPRGSAHASLELSNGLCLPSMPFLQLTAFSDPYEYPQTLRCNNLAKLWLSLNSVSFQDPIAHIFRYLLPWFLNWAISSWPISSLFFVCLFISFVGQTHPCSRVIPGYCALGSLQHHFSRLDTQESTLDF